MEMSEQAVREIFKLTRPDKEIIQEDDGLRCIGPYISWFKSAPTVTLDGEFSYTELEAIVYWMKTNMIK